MAKQQQQKQSPADQFSDPEMEQIKRYGQALGGAPTDFDEEVEQEINARRRTREANAQKMRAAQTGGSPGLGPTEAEQALAKQQQTLQQQAATTGAAAGQQAQAGQPPQPTPPPAPAGAAGVTKPYSAQAGAVGGAGEAPPGTQDQQQSAGGEPPGAPGEGAPEGEQGS
jgi:hypothetical protein